jgi:hypothetical protein
MKATCDRLLSNFALKLNLSRYIKVLIGEKLANSAVSNMMRQLAALFPINEVLVIKGRG